MLILNLLNYFISQRHRLLGQATKQPLKATNPEKP